MWKCFYRESLNNLSILIDINLIWCWPECPVNYVRVLFFFGQSFPLITDFLDLQSARCLFCLFNLNDKHLGHSVLKLLFFNITRFMTHLDLNIILYFLKMKFSARQNISRVTIHGNDSDVITCNTIQQGTVVYKKYSTILATLTPDLDCLRGHLRNHPSFESLSIPKFWNHVKNRGFKKASNVWKWLFHGNSVGRSVHCLDRN